MVYNGLTKNKGRQPNSQRKMKMTAQEVKRELEKHGQVIAVDKFSKIIIKTSPRKSGYLVSTYFRMDNSYIGCTHIAYNEIENYINYVLNEYQMLNDLYD